MQAVRESVGKFTSLRASLGLAVSSRSNELVLVAAVLAFTVLALTGGAYACVYPFPPPIPGGGGNGPDPDDGCAGCVGDGTVTEGPGGTRQPCGAIDSDFELCRFCVAYASTSNPILLRHGEVVEGPTDLFLPGPIGWSHRRTYNNKLAGATRLGNRWMSSDADRSLELVTNNNISYVIGASTQLVFVKSGSDYISPAGNSLYLEGEKNNDDTFTLTDTATGRVWLFHNFDGSVNAKWQGKLKEKTTIAWRAAGRAGNVYSYDESDGSLLQIMTAEGQDYHIIFDQNGTEVLQTIEVKDDQNATIMKAEYTYFEDVPDNNNDLGSTGDLVAVKVSVLASNDTNGTKWITRYTQYRYFSGSQLKAVYEADAIQRIIDDESDVTSPQEVLNLADSDPTDSAWIVQQFASRAFEYYLSNEVDTSNVDTQWEGGNENLENQYAGRDVDEAAMVKLERIGGVACCGGTGAVTRYYYYMDGNATVSESTAAHINITDQIVVEDTVDADGNAAFRTVYGVNYDGRMLRQIVIDDPTNPPDSANYWCKSYKLVDPTSDPDMSNRWEERRKPSAHDVIDDGWTKVGKFLNPFDGTSWAHDGATLLDTAGVIYVYTYNTDGNLTDKKIKQGENGTANYVFAADYTGGTNPFRKHLVTARYRYPTMTTTRTGGQEYLYTYTFWANTDTVKTKKEELPLVGTSENGPGGSRPANEEYYDEEGRLRWRKNAEGYVNYYSYHPKFGTLAYQMADVDTESTYGMDTIDQGYSGKWIPWDDETPGLARNTGLLDAVQIVTKWEYDRLGRENLHIMPSGAKHATAYNALETIRFPYWNGTSSLAPTEVSKTNAAGVVLEEYSVRASFSSFTTSGGVPTEFSSPPSQSDYVAWSKFDYNGLSGLLESVERFYDIGDELSYTTSYLYDSLGRRGATIVEFDSGKFQVDVTVFDVLGRAVETRKGVVATAPTDYDSLTPANGYATVSVTQYDGNGVGDGHVTKVKTYYDTDGSDYVETNLHRTFRGFLRAVERKNGGSTVILPHSIQDVDWEGKTIDQAQYTSTISSFSGLAANYVSATSSGRNDWVKTRYDVQGRVYRVERYPGTQSTNHHEINNYYDRNGRLLATGDRYSAHTEYAYDGAGREFQRRIVASPKFVSSVFVYRKPVPALTISDMENVTSNGDDQMIELEHRILDSSGDPIELHTFEVNHDDGDGLRMDGTTKDYVRRTVHLWYDGADRLEYTADYGSSNGGTTGTWKYVAAPSRSSSHLDWTSITVYSGAVHLTQFGFSDAGLQDLVARGVGYDGASNTTKIETKTFYDHLGRRVAVAENYKNYDASQDTGAGGGTNNEEDRVTKWQYDALNNITKLTAVNVGFDDQETEYKYTHTYDGTLVTLIKYPDGSTSGSDNVQMTYNLDGSLATRTDQRGVTLTNIYNAQRRLERQEASGNFGSIGVDDAILSIGRTYDDMGRERKISSYSDQNGTGTVENEIELTYETVGLLDRMYQSQQGAVNTGSTPYADWTYDTSVTSNIYTDGLRVTQVAYPAVSGAKVVYYYNTDDSRDERLHRTRYHKLWDGVLQSGDETHTVYYEYNGVERVAEVKSSDADLRRRMFSASGNYDSWDRFGRTITQAWKKTSSGAPLDQVDYLYDYADDRVTRDISSSVYSTDDKDQAYTYDGLQRLETANRGTLSGGTITDGAANLNQAWTLDQLGNWGTFKWDSTGGANSWTTQTRDHNDVNEIDTDNDHSNTPGNSISGTGADWVDPKYDATGNMIEGPTPGNETVRQKYVYDAWNRLVKVKDDGETVVASYEYDGLGRRIGKVVGDDTYRYYYNDQWQVLTEEKDDGSSTEQSIYSWHPFYIDAVAVRMRGTSQHHFFLQDANFNVTAAVDESTDSVVERYEYTPYGALQVLEADFDDLSASAIGNDVTYTGRTLDAETGLYYYRHRYYDPGLGRFGRRDPDAVRGNSAASMVFGGVTRLLMSRATAPRRDGPNLYQYVRSNPTKLADPSGRFSVCCTFSNGSEIWSETMDCKSHFELPMEQSAAACCGDYADGYLWDWELIGSRGGDCDTQAPSDPCDQDWTQMDWLDCMSCCIKNAGAPPAAVVGAGWGVLGIRRAKPHLQPNQYPDQSWLYGPRRCLPKSLQPTLNTTRTVGRWAGRGFILLGLIDAGIDGYCATQCLGQ